MNAYTEVFCNLPVTFRIPLMAEKLRGSGGEGQLYGSYSWTLRLLDSSPIVWSFRLLDTSPTVWSFRLLDTSPTNWSFRLQDICVLAYKVFVSFKVASWC